MGGGTGAEAGYNVRLGLILAAAVIALAWLVWLLEGVFR